MEIALKFALVVYASAAGAWDLFRRRIPNVLSLVALACALSISAMDSTRQLVFSLKGTAMGLGLGLLPFALKILGGGDVKVLAVLGSLVGPTALWEIFFYAILSLSMLGLLMLFYSNIASISKGQQFRLSSDKSGQGKTLKRSFPFSTFLAIASVLVLLKS